MAQTTSGIRAIFSSPRVYDAAQRLMGATRVRTELTTEFIKPTSGMRILDIGCGTSEILAFLPADVRYVGFDISERYVHAAVQRFGARGDFYASRLSRKQLAQFQPFDVVIAVGVLHHLDDGEAHDMLELAHEALVDDGRVITIDPCLAPGQNPLARVLILNDRGQNVRDEAGYRSLVSGRFRATSGQVRHRNWIPYTHWIMECQR